MTKLSVVVEDIEDHEDGSCTIQFEMSAEAVKFFAAIGLQKILTDKAMEVIDGHSHPEGSGDEGAREGSNIALSEEFPGF